MADNWRVSDRCATGNFVSNISLHGTRANCAGSGGVIRLSLTGGIVLRVPMTLIAAFAALFALGLLSLVFTLPSEFWKQQTLARD
jgi:hypothetical protein